MLVLKNTIFSAAGRKREKTSKGGEEKNVGLLTRLRQDRRSCGGADFFKCQTINMRKEHELSEARR